MRSEAAPSPSRGLCFTHKAEEPARHLLPVQPSLQLGLGRARYLGGEGVLYIQVVTKRTKNLKKQEIPSLDDPISKLNHIGKETVKKLNELAASAAEASLHLPVPHDLHR